MGIAGLRWGATHGGLVLASHGSQRTLQPNTINDWMATIQSCMRRYKNTAQETLPVFSAMAYVIKKTQQRDHVNVSSLSSVVLCWIVKTVTNIEFMCSVHLVYLKEFENLPPCYDTIFYENVKLTSSLVSNGDFFHCSKRASSSLHHCMFAEFGAWTYFSSIQVWSYVYLIS